MNILLVEDDPSIISLIQRDLMEQNISVSVALDGATGLSMAREHSFDIILLDIMIPIINGLEVCRTLRKEKIAVPILMITALGSTENVVTGLDSGADDYLTKPFKLSELHARVRALSRRASTIVEEDHLLKLGTLHLNQASKSVQRDGQAVVLTATEFKLLEYLMKNPNKVLSRVDILENVWDINFNLGTNVVDVYVNYLRKKIDKSFDNKMIQTMVGMGYLIKSDL